jgi:adenylate cyclase class 2
VKYIEVEKKFSIPEPDQLRAVLAERGASQKTATRQVDEYFNAPHKDFLAPEKVTEWVRIRTGDTTSSINYKCWHLDTDPVHADEFETTIDDPIAMRKTLEALDFQPMIIVDKTREAWRLRDVEIAFDTVADLGEFVEFEFKGDAETPADAMSRLEALINSFEVKLGDQIKRGYPHMLLGRDH